MFIVNKLMFSHDHFRKYLENINNKQQSGKFLVITFASISYLAEHKESINSKNEK